MLAYLFWHRPQLDVSPELYEQRLIEFHAALGESGIQSAAFRLERLPFGDGGGYEDWYLAEDWAAIGHLADVALAASPGPRHEAVAGLSGEGWGGVYALVRGEARPPVGARWSAKPPGEGLEPFLARHPGAAAWRRALVLGPAPEFCLAEGASPGRTQLWPA